MAFRRWLNCFKHSEPTQRLRSDESGTEADRSQTQFEIDSANVLLKNSAVVLDVVLGGNMSTQFRGDTIQRIQNMKELDYWRCSESLSIEPILHLHQLYCLGQHAKVAELGAEAILRPLGASLLSLRAGANPLKRSTWMSKKRSTWTLQHLKDCFNFRVHDASSVLAAWTALAQDLDSIAQPRSKPGPTNWVGTRTRASTSMPQIVPLAWSLVSGALATGTFNQLKFLPRGFVALMEAQVLNVLQGILRCAHKHCHKTIDKSAIEGNSTASQFTQDQVSTVAGCCAWML